MKLSLLCAIGLWHLYGTAIAEQADQFLTMDQALASVDDNHPAVQLNKQQQLTRRIEHCQEPGNALYRTALPESRCGFWHFLAPIQQQKLLVMRRFLDVVLADMASGRDNEAMATAFIDVDRARTRQQQGQRSDVDIAELEAVYQVMRQSYLRSQVMQRSSRSLLAVAMNDATRLPADVNPPDLAAYMAWERLEDKDTIDSVIKNNSVLQSVRQQNNEPLEKLVEQYLRHATLELLLSIDMLKIQQEEKQAMMNYRDLYMDRSRTLYDLEVKADLGDAMASQTESRLYKREIDYELALSITALQALLGQPVALISR